MGWIAAIDLGSVGRPLAIVASILLYTIVFTIAFVIGTARSVSVGQLVPSTGASTVPLPSGAKT